MTTDSTNQITLVLGGARSGKSRIAEDLAAHVAGHAIVTYLATAAVAPGDADGAARVAAHRLRRPSEWRTVETGAALVAALRAHRGPCVIVSEEVGGGLHPPTAIGRRLRDVPGEVNQAVPDEALLFVAGRVLHLDRWDRP